MLRPLYAIGMAYAALCAFAVGVTNSQRGRRVAVVEPAPATVGVAPTPASDAGRWFAAARAYCNPVEVEVRLRAVPPPEGAEGSAYAAACLALAGKIEHARRTIDALPAAGSARAAAAGVVFEVGHPVADAGDDAAAGPIMRLVIEYQPNNYMALYHAGMSEYALGHADVARDLLLRFRRIYTQDDGWTASAREVLGRLGEPR